MKSVESDIMSSSEASSMFCNSFWRGRGGGEKRGRREEGEERRGGGRGRRGKGEGEEGRGGGGGRGEVLYKEGGNKTFTFI